MSDRLTQLRNTIDRLDQAYYYAGDRTSVFPDSEYDKLKMELRTLAPDDPRLTRVGAPVPADGILTKARHDFLMGSLANAMTVDEFTAWAKSVGTNEYVLEPKMDGLSIGLQYVDGRLSKAITRGDGEYGELITSNAAQFRGVPLTLKQLFTGSVRGEAVLHFSEWKQIDPQQESNPRNMAAGIARRKDGEDAHLITFYAFDIIVPSGPGVHTELEKLEWLADLGFTVVSSKLVNSTQEVIDYHDELGKVRSNLPFLVDGLVVKANALELQRELGVVDRRPRAMIAFKWPAEEVTTILDDVTWQIGHTGKVSPVAKLKPVRIGGVTVSSALLCNMEEIERLGIKLKSTVRVIRAGEVIPKIIGLADEQKTIGYVGDPTIKAPTEIDGYPVTRRKNTDGSDTVDLYVDTTHPAVQRGKIKNWIKKLDIQGIGDEVLDALLSLKQEVPHKDERREAPIIKSIADLYRLRKLIECGLSLDTLLVNGKKLGTSRAEKILANIDAKRKLTIEQFLGSLGIDGLGRRRVQLIREAAPTMHVGWQGSTIPSGMFDTLLPWFSTEPSNPCTSLLITHSTQLGIPGIAAELQAGIDAAKPLIEELLRAGVEIIQPAAPVVVAEDSPLKGKSFCFTGVRATAEEKERMAILGAEEKNGVSRGLTYLVTKDPASTSSKATKARELGTEVISYERFKEMVG